jgi:5'-3' exonuclease
LFRSTTLNTIRSLKKKFENKYGELVIATDGRRSWRKEVFPQYKANRKKTRDTSEIDWQLIFSNLNTVRDELKENFPYRVIHVDTAEADDIIGTIVLHLSSSNSVTENVLILSGDKDFIQLQRYNSGVHVDQYDPVNKKFITSDDPIKFMKEHVLKGDTGDGIPNFLSPDNSFIESIRQKPVTKKNLEQWVMYNNPNDFCSGEQLRNYKRNETLIDLSMTPDQIKNKILSEFNNQQGKDRSKIFNFMVKNRLKVLLESINEF